MTHFNAPGICTICGTPVEHHEFSCDFYTNMLMVQRKEEQEYWHSVTESIEQADISSTEANEMGYCSVPVVAKYEVGDEIVFLYDDLEASGYIEKITNTSVHICRLNGDLLIASVDCILYKLIY